MTGIKESQDDEGGAGFHSHMPKLGMVALGTPVLWNRTGAEGHPQLHKVWARPELPEVLSQTHKEQECSSWKRHTRGPQNCLVTTDHLAEFQLSCFLLN